METTPQSNPLSGFHKQKLYALVIAVVGIIACILPWWSFGGGSVYGFSVPSVNINGLHELGIVAFLAFIGATVLCFIGGPKDKPFDGQFKMMAAGAFGLAALITLIQFIRVSSGTSFGIWLSLLAGIAGAVVVYVLKPEQLGTKPPSA